MKEPQSAATATDSSQRTQSANAGPTVQFDVSKLQSSYANVCNISSTREEVAMAFGVNTVWERGQANVQIQMTNRIVLNPHAAKRLSVVLNQVITEYEAKFGTLKDDSKPQRKAA